MDKNFLRIFVPVFGLVGLVFLAVASFSIRSEIQFRTGAIRVPGIVVEMERTRGSKGETMYRPVFQFADLNDRVHKVTGSVASSPPAYDTGESVTVLYRPESPETAQLDSFMDAWFLPLVFGLLGSVFTSIGGGVLIYAIRHRRRPGRRPRNS
jgi:hypothetical protein